MRLTALRIALVILALASVFFFPYPYTLALSLAASTLFPPAGFLAGALSDLVYYAPPGLPLATIAGAGASVLGLLVRRFVKARIMTE